MELTLDQQIFEQVKKSNKILIALPQNLTADALGSGLALRLFLSKQQKDAVLLSAGQVPENLKFLPGSGDLQNSIAASKSLVVTLDASVKKLEEISYQTAADKVNIYLKSKDAEFTAQDITFTQEKSPVDLIFILGAKSLEDLGKISQSYSDLLFETPKINIDNKPGNEYFGSVNLVDITATSSAEILAELMAKYEQQLIDEDVATCLLAGIIAKTHSFQHVQTTPKAFLKASQLVSLGGRQQEIIKNIYKTKSLPLLKLWGRALARMRILEEQKTVYSVLGQADFEKAGASAQLLLPVLKEFDDNINGYKILALIAEPNAGTFVLQAALHQQIPADKFVKALGGQGKILDFSFGNYTLFEQDFTGVSLENVESLFLEALNSL